MSMFAASFNTVSQPQLNSNVASVWLDPLPEPNSVPIATSMATSTVAQDAPVVGISSLVPKSCLKEVLACELSPVGFHLPGAIKGRIWKGEYIEILSLLPSTHEHRSDKKEGDHKDDDKRRNAPCSFNNWLQAFCIYDSMLGEKRPDLCSSLFQHVEITKISQITKRLQKFLRFFVFFLR